MKRPGLTEAMRKALEGWPAQSAWMRFKAYDAGFAKPVSGITPRGQAALAAPRITAAEVAMLERLESWSGIVHGRDVTTAANLNKRGLACAFKSSGFIKVRKTDAGTTALNNVRAASGSPDWRPQ